MRLRYFIFIFSVCGIVLAQKVKTIPFRDSVMVYGNTVSSTGTEIDLKKLSNISLTAYDPLSSLNLLNASYTNDFNVLPLLEGADYQEQEFLIDEIPSLFPVSLLGVQSGLNSLLFSSIRVGENLLTKSFRKSVMLNADVNHFENNDITAAVNLSNLRNENLLYLPLKSINTRLSIGYNRSLLETMKPVYKNIINNEYSFPSFPFYKGFQIYSTTTLNNLTVTNLLMMNQDNGTARISSKDFYFKSNALSFGSKIRWTSPESVNTITLHYLDAENNISYSFNEGQRKVSGLAELGAAGKGIDLNSKIKLSREESILLNACYKYDSGNSENESNYYGSNKTMAAYKIHAFEIITGFEKLLSPELIIGSAAGVSTVAYLKTGYFYNLDLLLNIPPGIDCSFILDYRRSCMPSNTIFYTFQNSIWDPASTNTLYFIDQKDLPLKPVNTLTLSASVSNQFSAYPGSSGIELKLFYRQIENLIFSNNYPLEATYYNTDFSFNQKYDAVKYGAMVTYTHSFHELSLDNRIAAAFSKSLNIDQENDLLHHALNYNPVIVTGLINWQPGKFNLSSYISFRQGRYIFDKNLEKYLSFDSTYAYSLSTDLTEQKNLNSQFRMDLSLGYLVLSDPLNLKVGLSIINLFNGSFESNRLFSYDLNDLALHEKSEYISLPRFFIFNINMNYSMK